MTSSFLIPISPNMLLLAANCKGSNGSGNRLADANAEVSGGGRLVADSLAATPELSGSISKGELGWSMFVFIAPALHGALLLWLPAKSQFPTLANRRF